MPEWRFTVTMSPAARRGTPEPLRWKYNEPLLLTVAANLIIQRRAVR